MSAIIKRPFLPKITIKKNDATLLTYDPTAGANPPTSGTYDFRLVKGNIKAPYDSTGGRFELTIVSSDVTNSGMNTILTNIREDNEVTIWVGKTAATLVKIFLGKIETIKIKEPNKDLMLVTLSGPDWGSDILKNLVCNYSWVQKKTVADQNKLDADDFATTVGQITFDLLTDSKVYPDVLATVAPDDLGVIVTTGNYPSVTTSYQVPQFEANMERVDEKLTELDELQGTTHFIDADKIFYMKQAETISVSGVLLTDDTADSVISATYNTKVGFIAPDSIYTKTVENHKARLYGIGSSTFSKDKSNEVIGASPVSLTSLWYAQKFTPVKQDCYSIGVYVGYTGTPTIDLTLLLVEDNGGVPTGSTLRTLSVNYTRLAIGGAWYYFPIEQKVTKNSSYWVILAGNFAGNSYTWHHDNVDAVGNATTMMTSSNGVSWSNSVAPNRFKLAFVEYANDPLVKIYPTGITSATKHLHDEVIRRLDITDDQFMSVYISTLYSHMGDRKEIFRGRIYAPDTLLKPNQLVRIRKQLSGYIVDANFVLGQVEYIFDSSDDMATGTLYIDVEAVRFVTYP